MATTKKPAAKKVAAKKVAAPAKKAPAKKVAVKKAEVLYNMPLEVKEWIERATSSMNYLKGEVDRLTRENEELKSYKKWAEYRILRSEAE